MALKASCPYPAATSTDEGWAVIRIPNPHQRAFERRNDELVDAVRSHARDWELYAATLQSLMDAGWTLQGQGGVYATRQARAAELAGLLEPDIAPGFAVHWCVADSEGALLGAGGMLSGHPVPADVFPGSMLPALLSNELTGAQRIVRTPHELCDVMRGELRACANWWREHPQARSDHDAHGLPGELDELAANLAPDEVPSWVTDANLPSRVFSDAPHTRLAVHPVSAVVFAGAQEAAGTFGTLELHPRDGLARGLLHRGAQLAGELGATRER